MRSIRAATLDIRTNPRKLPLHRLRSWRLTLDDSSNQVSGEVKYAEKGTKYVLRTYFAEKEGGADYLIDEQINVDPNSISVDIPDRGTHAPSGEYYVTSFLMTEKTTTVADENGESENVTALMAIDSWQSKDNGALHEQQSSLLLRQTLR